MSQLLSYPPPLPPRRPVSITVIAWVFIAFGILAAIDIVWSLFLRRLSLNFGVLGIFIGHGLLRLSNTARIWALVFIWVQLIGFALIAFLGILFPSNLYFAVNGQRRPITSTAGVAAFVGVFLVLFFLSLWELLILMRTSTRDLFLNPRLRRPL